LQRLEPRAYIIAARIGRNDTGGTSDILRLGESIWRIPGGHTQGQLQAHLLGGQESCGAGKLKPDFSINARWYRRWSEDGVLYFSTNDCQDGDCPRPLCHSWNRINPFYLSGHLNLVLLTSPFALIAGSISLVLLLYIHQL